LHEFAAKLFEQHGHLEAAARERELVLKELDGAEQDELRAIGPQ